VGQSSAKEVAVRAVGVLGLGLGAVALILAFVVLRYRNRSDDTNLVDPDRRRFLNRTLIGSLGIFAVALGGGTIVFLWPDRRGPVGGLIVAGKRKDLLFQIDLEERPVYNADGKFYVVRYDTSDPDNFYVRAGVAKQGLMAISQRCSHLGCRVPYCPTSGWFECPCHSARFNGAGEFMNGPTPAGMWRHPIEIDDSGNVIVDISRRRAQPPAGFETAGEAPAGAFCVRG
jgi:cytochrome b6-f complex iron-sulfur subunit